VTLWSRDRIVRSPSWWGSAGSWPSTLERHTWQSQSTSNSYSKCNKLVLQPWDGNNPVTASISFIVKYYDSQSSQEPSKYQYQQIYPLNCIIIHIMDAYYSKLLNLSHYRLQHYCLFFVFVKWVNVACVLSQKLSNMKCDQNHTLNVNRQVLPCWMSGDVTSCCSKLYTSTVHISDVVTHRQTQTQTQT